MPLPAVLLLAAGTFAFRVAGPVLGHRFTLSDRLRHLLGVAAAVLLVALVATGTFTQGHDFAGWARPAGVLAAGVLAVRRAPFPLVVVAGAATTAVLRLCGVA
ncbi:AzlD domain-containing protein [Kitasatospora sp. NPDC090091]|uniref:AzlD domain-containing protein n=1 Tax=Kitasatospora sp. NPDC090091 TaxID=3364081 RepID=UPI0037F3CD19